MSLSIGIVGLPNVGKSTLFNALLKRQVALAANYPFATIEPNVGIVDVPDFRLEVLAQIIKDEFQEKYKHKEVPEKIIPATIKFVDIAGLVKGASKGEGLGNQFLGHIRSVDAIVHVIRAFEDSNVVKEGSVDPESDKATIKTELILADLQSLENQLPNLQKRATRANEKEAYALLKVVEKSIEILNSGDWISEQIEKFTKDEQVLLKQLFLLTAKPFINVYNVSEAEIGSFNTSDYDNSDIYLSAKIESEIATLSEEDAKLFMVDLGIATSGLDKVIKRSYDLLNLQTFLTAGPKEVRAWTIPKNCKAPEAAGVIHTDFQRGFISADVINFSELQNVGSFKIAKEKGLIRLEGKEYVMKDGDVVEFKFNV